MKNYLLIYFLLALTSICFGQEEVKPKLKLIFSPGISYQKQFIPELNMMFSRSDVKHGGNAIWGPRIGAESNFSKNDLIAGVKLGYELTGLIVCFRGNVISYFYQNRTDLRLLPEFGLSLFGTVNLTYGYSLPVLNYKISTISNHRITLTFNLDFDLWRAL